MNYDMLRDYTGKVLEIGLSVEMSLWECFERRPDRASLSYDYSSFTWIYFWQKSTFYYFEGLVIANIEPYW